MPDGSTRVVDGVRERLYWRFLVHGRVDPTYEPASGRGGPFDPDRRRCLKRGETFQRLDGAGRPRTYEGLSWRPDSQVENAAPPLVPPVPGKAHRSMTTESLRSELDTAEQALAVAENELAEAVRLIPNASRSDKTVPNERVEGALEDIENAARRAAAPRRRRMTASARALVTRGARTRLLRASRPRAVLTAAAPRLRRHGAPRACKAGSSPRIGGSCLPARPRRLGSASPCARTGTSGVPPRPRSWMGQRMDRTSCSCSRGARRTRHLLGSRDLLRASAAGGGPVRRALACRIRPCPPQLAEARARLVSGPSLTCLDRELALSHGPLAKARAKLLSMPTTVDEKKRARAIETIERNAVGRRG
jgi:hypothetical protein